MRSFTCLGLSGFSSGVAFALLGCASRVPMVPPAVSPEAEAPARAAPCLPPARPASILTSTDAGFPSSACIARADEILAGLSLEEKAGQLLQPDLHMLASDDQVRRFAFGSVLSGGGSDPNTNDVGGWAARVAQVKQAALEARLALPLLYGIDAVHGHNNVEGAVLFPHNIGLGATRDPDLLERIGRVTAEEAAATHIDWTFAPVLAAARDERWGRTYEAFGETAELAELLGPALIRGLQGERPGAAAPSVLACAKHFVADGGTVGGDDQGDARVSEAELREVHLRPYRAAIGANVGTVMASFSSVAGVRMHCHGPLLNDVLKGELAFRGFVVSDWRAIEKIEGDYVENLGRSLNAGVDMFMAPQQYDRFPLNIKLLVERGAVPPERIDDAVRRILSVKCELGLLARAKGAVQAAPAATLAPKLQSRVGGPAHRAVAREAVRKSVVLLKNEGGVLPLRKGLARIHVVGEIANDLGSQCGGWSIDWQGRRGQLTAGTTLLAGVREVAGYETRVTYSSSTAGLEDADALVAVIGEAQPYAEGDGDRADLSLTPADVKLVADLHRVGKPLVVVIISGRPLILGPVLEQADALLAAWLPGTEGAGVADILFGDHSPTGRLGHSWPRTMQQIPINVGAANYDPLFAYGFGMSYGARAVVPGAQPAPTG